MCDRFFNLPEKSTHAVLCPVNQTYLNNLSIYKASASKFSVDWIISQFLPKPALSQPVQPSNLDDQRLAFSSEISAFDIFGRRIFSSLVETEV